MMQRVISVIAFMAVILTGGVAFAEGSASLTWTAATDNVGVVAYHVERCTGPSCTAFAEVAVVTGLTYAEAGLADNEFYTYRVRARDAAGNLGGYSNLATKVTPATGISALRLAWAFDEGSGTTAQDASTFDHDGTTTNTTWTASGHSGNALVFNGTSSNVQRADNGNLDLSTGMTLEAWVYPQNGATNWWLIIEKTGPFALALVNRIPVLLLQNTSIIFSQLTAGSALPLDTWSHVAATYDGGTMRLFVAGVQVASQAFSGVLFQSSTPVSVGGGGNNWFSGRIDDVRLWAQARTASQITEDMNTPVAPFTPSTPTAVTGVAIDAITNGSASLSWMPPSDASWTIEVFWQTFASGGSTTAFAISTPVMDIDGKFHATGTFTAFPADALTDHFACFNVNFTNQVAVDGPSLASLSCVQIPVPALPSIFQNAAISWSHTGLDVLKQIEAALTFDIYRAPALNGTYTLAQAGATGRTFLDTAAPAPVECIKIIAKDLAGTPSAESAQGCTNGQSAGAGVTVAIPPGVIRVLTTNPRWLDDGTGRGKYFAGLTGDEPWKTLQDISACSSPTTFDFNAALNGIVTSGLNFIRLWQLEQSSVGNSFGTLLCIPLTQFPWLQTGTRVDTSTGGNVTVGVYNLTAFNQAYFDRVRARVQAAADRGLGVSMMLFSGGHLSYTTHTGFSHPFRSGNNTNSVSADTNGNGRVEETHTLANPTITAFQDAYVRKMIDTLNSFDNLIWEISNEDFDDTTAWHNHMADVIRAYEGTGGRKIHPVWFSAYGDLDGTVQPNNNYLFNNPKPDIVGPSLSGGAAYDTNPPVVTGSGVIAAEAFADAFTRADSADLGADYGAITGTTALQIVSNKVRSSALGSVAVLADIVKVQSRSNTGSGTLAALTYLSTNAADRLLLVRFAGGTGIVPTGCTDTRGNSWLPIPSATGTGPTGDHQAWFYVKRSAAGANTVQCPLSGNAAYFEFDIFEFSGTDLDNPLGPGNVNPQFDPGTAVNAVTTVAVTAARDKALIVGGTLRVGGSGNSTAVGTGFTQLESAFGDSPVESKLLTTAGSAAATFTASAADNDYLSSVLVLYPAIATPASEGSSERNSTVLSADQYAQATLATWTGAAGRRAGVMVRASASGGTGMMGFVTSGGAAGIGKLAGGVVSVLSSVAHTTAASQVLRLEVVGTTYQFFVNGVLKVSLTDASLSEGAAGLSTFVGSGGSVGDVELDLFSSGTLLAGASAKVVFVDTDHFAGAGTVDALWPWKVFTRGLYPMYLSERESASVKAAIYKAQKQTIAYAARIHLNTLIPETGTSICSTGYCLYSAGNEYLMYLPTGGTQTIDLTAAPGTFNVEYFRPSTEVTVSAPPVAGGASRNFAPTGWSGETVVYLKRQGLDVPGSGIEGPSKPFAITVVGTVPNTTVKWSHTGLDVNGQKSTGLRFKLERSATAGGARTTVWDFAATNENIRSLADTGAVTTSFYYVTADDGANPPAEANTPGCMGPSCPADATAPTVPYAVAVSGTTPTFTVKWSHDGLDANGAKETALAFRVQRAATVGGGRTTVSGCDWVTATLPGPRSCSDTGAGATAFYWVEARDAVPNTSAASNPGCRGPSCPADTTAPQPPFAITPIYTQ